MERQMLVMGLLMFQNKKYIDKKKKKDKRTSEERRSFLLRLIGNNLRKIMATQRRKQRL